MVLEGSGNRGQFHASIALPRTKLFKGLLAQVNGKPIIEPIDEITAACLGTVGWAHQNADILIVRL